MAVTLTDPDKLTLRNAAHGAVLLMASARAADALRGADVAPVTLDPAPGLVAEVLAERPAHPDPDAAPPAEAADRVLPALTAAMNLLGERAPTEAGAFRSTVVAAVEDAAGAHRGVPGPATVEMARRIVAALDVTPAGPGATAPQAAAGQDRPELRRLLRETVDSGFVGAQLRLHDERGQWAASAGASELGGTEEPSTDGRFRIGSNTKTFLATVVLLLVAEEMLGLDDPVDEHLPGFGLDRRITVRMLLQHTSGIFNFTGEHFEDGTVVPGIPWQGREWVENRFRTYRPEELVRLALSRPTRFEPGAGWSYSNTNYVLARLLVEKITGRSLAEEMRRLVLGPLGMTDTVVPTTQSDIDGPHAHTYYRYERDGRETTVDVTSQNPSWISSGGDMISTTRDLQTFVSALAGGRLLPTPLLAEMCTPHPESGYGLGVFVQQAGPDGPTVITHNGGIAGNAALMYSTPGGHTTLTASLTYVDDAGMSLAGAFRAATEKLLHEVFAGRRDTDGNNTGTDPDKATDAAASTS